MIEKYTYIWYAWDMKVVVVMPAYNAEKTLEKTYKDIPKKSVDEVILVDDHSGDKTVALAKKLKLKVFVHKANQGYGGNQKTCYQQALKSGADIVIMLHPDYQYDPKLIPILIQPIKEGYFDVMLGSRIRTRAEALDGGMPVYKYIGNRFLTFMANIALGLSLSEYHTGYRAYSKAVLKKIPFKTFSNDFVFDQQFLIHAHKHGFKIGEIAVPVKYFPEASSINFRRSSTYGLMVMKEIGRYLLKKHKKPISRRKQ